MTRRTQFLLAASMACILVAAQTGAQTPKDFGVPLSPPDPLESFTSAIAYGHRRADDAAAFEKFAVAAKKSGYNTIHCAFRDDRLESCRKLGLKLMIDAVTAPTDVRQPAQREALRRQCEKLKGDVAVWGYFLWNDGLDRFAPAGSDSANECLALLRTWDTARPVWLGAKSFDELEKVQGTVGMLASNDADTAGGPNHDAKVLTQGLGLSQSRIDPLGRTLTVKGDPQYARRSLNMSLAHGVKAVLWAGAGAVDPKSGLPLENACLRELPKMGHEIMEIDRPVAVYSTPTTRTPDDKEKPKDVPAPLAPFPADCWIQVVSGEAVIGFFKHDFGFDNLFVANHNALRPQQMTLQIKPAGKDAPSVEIFHRAAGEWRRLKVVDGRASFDVEPAGGELLRLLGVASG